MNLHVSIIPSRCPITRRLRNFLSLWIANFLRRGECRKLLLMLQHHTRLAPPPHLVSLHRNYWIFMTRQIFFQTFLNSTSPCNFVFKMNWDDEVKNRLISRGARVRVKIFFFLFFRNDGIYYRNNHNSLRLFGLLVVILSVQFRKL